MYQYDKVQKGYTSMVYIEGVMDDSYRFRLKYITCFGV
jgi:hypothetical protein